MCPDLTQSPIYGVLACVSIGVSRGRKLVSRNTLSLKIFMFPHPLGEMRIGDELSPAKCRGLGFIWTLSLSHCPSKTALPKSFASEDDRRMPGKIPAGYLLARNVDFFQVGQKIAQDAPITDRRATGASNGPARGRDALLQPATCLGHVSECSVVDCIGRLRQFNDGARHFFFCDARRELGWTEREAERFLAGK